MTPSERHATVSVGAKVTTYGFLLSVSVVVPEGAPSLPERSTAETVPGSCSFVDRAFDRVFDVVLERMTMDLGGCLACDPASKTERMTATEFYHATKQASTEANNL